MLSNMAFTWHMFMKGNAVFFFYAFFKQNRWSLNCFMYWIEPKMSNCLLFYRSSMDIESSAVKRCHQTTGATPLKPRRKRVRQLFSPCARKHLFDTESLVNSPDDHSFRSPNRKVSGTFKISAPSVFFLVCSLYFEYYNNTSLLLFR